MTGVRKYRGPQVTRLKRQMLAIYGDVCHLCGHPGADSVDHLIPKSIRPDLMYDIGNVRPAHRQCNSKRHDALLPEYFAAVGW